MSTTATTPSNTTSNTDAGSWESVRLFAEQIQPQMSRWYDCDPAWDLEAIYDKPDGELPHPDRELARRHPEKAGEFTSQNKMKYVFWDRHIDRRFSIRYPATRSDSPRPVSKTLGDPARDWDALITHRDRYLADAGLTLRSKSEDIARCLADSFRCFSYFKDKPTCTTFAEDARSLCHPIEGLLHKSFCVGCAHAFAALADASGLPARTIGCGAHRVAEVLIDGRWRFVENSGRHAGLDDLHALFPASFMAVTLDPLSYLQYMPAKTAGSYWGMPNGQFHFMSNTWQTDPTLRYAACNAAALYPEMKRYGFKSYDGKRMPIFLRKNGFYRNIVHASDEPPVKALRDRTRPFELPPGSEAISDFLYHPLAPGQRLRQSFWLGDLDGVRALELAIPIAPQAEIAGDNALGAQLHVSVGEWGGSLAQLNAWPPSPVDNRGHHGVSVTIPPAALKAHAVNWIEFTNHSMHTLHHPFIPALMEPYVSPLGGPPLAG